MGRHVGALSAVAAGLPATVALPGLGAQATAEVFGESRTIPVRAGTFQDKFEPYDAHIYRIR